MARVPWSKRKTEQGRQEFAVLREGVPDGLLRSLVTFVNEAMYIKVPYEGLTPLQDLHDAFARQTDVYLPARPDHAAKLFLEDRELLLDVVDFVVGTLEPESYSTENVLSTLEAQLVEARSAYTVGRDGDGLWELQNRQPDEMSWILKDATGGADRASVHLRRAWSKLYGRNRDHNGACVEAVAAVEVVAKPIVSPRNAKTTLGTIIRDMKAKPSKWTTASDADADVEKVISMLDIIWLGHYRHGNEDDPIEVSQDAAVMVVQLAAVLVGWFKAGLVRPL